MLMNNHWIRKKVKRYIERNAKKNYNTPKSLGCSKSGSKREVCSITGLPQETKISNNATVYLKELEKRKQSPNSVEGGK